MDYKGTHSLSKAIFELELKVKSSGMNSISQQEKHIYRIWWLWIGVLSNDYEGFFHNINELKEKIMKIHSRD